MDASPLRLLSLTLRLQVQQQQHQWPASGAAGQHSTTVLQGWVGWLKQALQVLVKKASGQSLQEMSFAPLSQGARPPCCHDPAPHRAQGVEQGQVAACAHSTITKHLQPSTQVAHGELQGCAFFACAAAAFVCS